MLLRLYLLLFIFALNSGGEPVEHCDSATDSSRCGAAKSIVNSLQEDESSERDKRETSANEVDSNLNSVKVETPFGTIHGKVESTKDGVEITKYLGIPFAQPPIGNLRFQPPVPVASYNDFKAFKFGSMCPQPNLYDVENPNSLAGDEDCLHLNIYNKATSDSSLKPVMVWIHGGAFIMGAAQVYDPTPLVKEDVVVVTINYRLGAMGFLNFGNDIAPGNLGLRDQILALKWVKKMIQYFGGDPNAVTIFGESAGGMSVHALTMSPKAEGLFSGAIMESGTMLMMREDPKVSKTHRAAQGAAIYHNCPSTNYDDSMLKCLQGLSIKDLVTGTSFESPTGVVKDGDGNPVWPVMDSYSSDPVMPHDYLTAVKKGYFHQVPMMMGTILNDGALMFPELEYGQFWETDGARFLFIRGSFNTSEVTEEEKMQAKVIKRYYTGKNSNLIETLPDFANMITDSIFLSPDQKVAELYSQYVPVFNYRFAFSGSHSFLPFFLNGREAELGEDLINSLKPVHADELLYLFDIDMLPNALATPEELDMRKTLVKYWTNFAKYKHPSPTAEEGVTQWLPYSSEKNYMILDAEARMETNVEKERMFFWDKVHWNQREAKIDDVSIFDSLYETVLGFI